MPRMHASLTKKILQTNVN